jgi:hypothetical protein
VQLLTLFVACGLGAMFTALGVNSPERRAVNSQLAFKEQYNVTNTAILDQLYAAAAGPANAAVVTTLNVRVPEHPCMPHIAHLATIQLPQLSSQLKGFVLWLQSLNETFYTAWQPDQPDFSDLLSVNADIFSQFNSSLAYNPFTQVWRLLVLTCAPWNMSKDPPLT